MVMVKDSRLDQNKVDKILAKQLIKLTEQKDPINETHRLDFN
jgi:hypothetical protein